MSDEKAKDAEQSHAITQIMKNSPGDIQNTGSITIHQAPPSRKLTDEQRRQFVAFLRPLQKGTVDMMTMIDDRLKLIIFQTILWQPSNKQGGT